MKITSRAIGDSQEVRAWNYFLNKGWRLIQRNYRCRWGEIDLLCEDDEGFIVFVEVRYRSRPDFGSAQSTVTAQKQNRILKTALFFIKQKQLFGKSFRFDVLALTPEKIEYIPNAFSAEGYTL